MSTITLPQVFLNFEASLASSMSDSATSFTLNIGVDDDGTALSSRFYLTFDEGLPTEEHMIVTIAGTAGTIVLRGISRVDGTTEKSANKFAHDKGASVKITDYALVHITRLLRGVDTFNAVDLLGINSISGLVTPTSGETTKVANVDYVNNVAIAGSPDSAEGVKGLVDKATTAQTKAGDDIGSTTAPLIAVPSDIAANTQSGTFVYATDAGATDTYVITLVPAITAYTVGMSVYFKANTINTGPATLNVNALGAKAILKLNDQVLEDGDIEANSIIQVIYDGTSFQLQTPPATIPSTAILSEMATFFGATDITGAEAEELTNGSTTSKHFHNIKLNTGTRANADGSGAETVAVGFIPKYCLIEWAVNGIVNNAINYNMTGNGRSDGTNNYTSYAIHATVAQTTHYSINTSYCINATVGSTNAKSWLATITFNTTNVEINWTKDSTGGDAPTISYILTTFG